MSRIEAGKTKLSEESFSLGLMVEDIVEMMRLRAERKGLILTVEAESRLPRHLHTDEQKLRQVLINLMGNAVKYTEEGHIQLTVDVDAAYANREPGLIHIEFQVRDTGVGIASENLEGIYEPFIQKCRR